MAGGKRCRLCDGEPPRTPSGLRSGVGLGGDCGVAATNDVPSTGDRLFCGVCHGEPPLGESGCPSFHVPVRMALVCSLQWSRSRVDDAVGFSRPSALLRSSLHRTKRSRAFLETRPSLPTSSTPASLAKSRAPSPTSRLGGTRRSESGLLLLSRMTRASVMGFLTSVAL